MDYEIKEYFEICSTYSKKQINQKIFINMASPKTNISPEELEELLSAADYQKLVH
jgi:hypothetical protein